MGASATSRQESRRARASERAGSHWRRSGDPERATPAPVRGEAHWSLQQVDSSRIKRYTRRVSRDSVNPTQHWLAQVVVEQNLLFISVAAEILGMHPQTLRKYERLGLIQPSRTVGSMRLYSREELEKLRLIKHLVDELGINLAGVQRLLSIAEVMQRIRPLMDEGALSTGAGRKQLVTEMRRLNEAIGL